MKSTNILRFLTERHKLTLRNLRTGKDVWHIFTSRLNMFFYFLLLIVVLFGGIFTIVSYTSILDFAPGYPGSKSREMIVENLSRIDSMELKLKEWETFNQSLVMILEGNIVPGAGLDSLVVTKKGTLQKRSISDSLLRLQMKTDSNYMLVAKTRKSTEETFKITAPIRGKITTSFDPKKSIYGIEIAPGPNQSIISILDGTVILTTWNPTDGHLIIIEHAANMVSIYKNVSRLLCKTGQRVRTGEVIALFETPSDGLTSPLRFELWHNGNAVDPESYMSFK